MQTPSINSVTNRNTVYTPSVASRLNYIQARLQGLTPGRMIEQALEERTEQIENQVQHLAVALLERQKQVEHTISELATEVESLEIFEPTQKQTLRLQETFSNLQQKQASLSSEASKEQQSLDLKTRRRNQLAAEIKQLNEIARQPQSNSLTIFLDQLGQKLPNYIHCQLSKN